MLQMWRLTFSSSFCSVYPGRYGITIYLSNLVLLKTVIILLTTLVRYSQQYTILQLLEILAFRNPPSLPYFQTRNQYNSSPISGWGRYETLKTWLPQPQRIYTDKMHRTPLRVQGTSAGNRCEHSGNTSTCKHCTVRNCRRAWGRAHMDK